MSLIIGVNAYCAAPISILERRDMRDSKGAGIINMQGEKLVQEEKRVVKNKPSVATVTTIKKTKQRRAKKVNREPINIQGKQNTFERVLTENSKPLVISNIEKPEIVMLELEENKNNTFLTFLSKGNLKAASFVKNGKLNIVFDKKLLFDLAYMPSKGVRVGFENFEQKYLSSGATLISIDVDITGNTVRFIKKGTYWILEIYDDTSSRSDFFSDNFLPKIDTKDITSSVFFMTDDDAPMLVDYKDPNDGSKFILVLLGLDKKSVKVERNFNNFKLHKTFHGIVIESFSDTLEVCKGNSYGSVVIDDVSGLNVAPSALAAVVGSASLGAFGGDNLSIINASNYRNWRKSFSQSINELNLEIANSTAQKKELQKLNLAMYYFSNMFYKEAGVIVDSIIDSNTFLAADYRIRFFSAVIDFLSGDSAIAMQKIHLIDNDEIALQHIDEIVFWRSIIAYKSNDPYLSLLSPNVIRTFNNWKTNFLREYNKEVVLELIFIVLQYKLDNKIVEDAGVILDIIQGIGKLNRVAANRLDYDLGVYNELINNPKDAVAYFSECSKNILDELHYSRCRVSNALLKYRLGLMKTEDVTEELERAALTWRGDGLEIDIIKELFSIYVKNGKYADAMYVGKKIMLDHPGTIEAIKMNNEVSKLYIGLFLENNYNARLTPLDALELFYGFQEFIPVGERGDEVILKVVDYMLDLDLLDKAEVLLEHQVENRLYGIRKEREFNKLANIYLLNQRPYKLADIFKNISKYGLSTHLELERNQIIAKALIQTGKYEVAMRLLKYDYSVEADEIRSDFYWSNKDWVMFNKYSEPHIFNLREGKDVIRDKDILKIYRQLVSYLFSKKISMIEDLYLDTKSRFISENHMTKIIDYVYQYAKLHDGLLTGQLSKIEKLAYNMYSIIKEADQISLKEGAR
ncbi:hypothetical protein [Candidatus Cyrtobacter comes]|uniref:hypothetical protein n=1 Tax=Candidatus Cyrtobacter comes TaxID=675776 RepID=UPI002ACD2509|nr:hypothetical protein [Candidatus Cyrtobacter comes]